LIKDAGYGFELAPSGSRHLGSANGVTVGGDLRLVQVRDDVSTAQRLKTTLHDSLTAPTRPRNTGCRTPVRTRRAGDRPRPPLACGSVLRSFLVAD